MHVDYEDPIFTFMQSELEVVENLEVLIDTLLDQGAKISTQNKKIIETIISTMAKSTLINKKIDESSINLVQDINRVKKNIEITMGAQIAMIKSAAQLDEERIVKFLEKNEIKLKKNQDLERKNFAIYLVSISFASSFIASTIAFLLFK
jgi:DNA relaxase NicK